MGASISDISDTVHAHPTISEAFQEAALDAAGKCIHMSSQNGKMKTERHEQEELHEYKI